jgi:hypothetical protein
LKQFPKLAPVIKAAFYFRYNFIGNIERKALTFDSPAQNVAGMLFAPEACLAILSNALGAAKAKRTQSSRPKIGSLLEPLRNIFWKFFLFGYDSYMSHSIYIANNYLLFALIAIC